MWKRDTNRDEGDFVENLLRAAAHYSPEEPMPRDLVRMALSRRQRSRVKPMLTRLAWAGAAVFGALALWRPARHVVMDSRRGAPGRADTAKNRPYGQGARVRSAAADRPGRLLGSGTETPPLPERRPHMVRRIALYRRSGAMPRHKGRSDRTAAGRRSPNGASVNQGAAPVWVTKQVETHQVFIAMPAYRIVRDIESGATCAIPAVLTYPLRNGDTVAPILPGGRVAMQEAGSGALQDNGRRDGTTPKEGGDE